MSKKADDNKQKLISTVSENGIEGWSSFRSKMTLEILLMIIQSPDDLKNLFTVLDNLSEIIECIESGELKKHLKYLEVNQFDLISIKELIRHILDDELKILSSLSDDVARYSYHKNKNPMYGRIGEFYIYSMFLTSSADEKSDSNYRCLQARILIGICLIRIKLLNKENEYHQYRNKNLSIFDVLIEGEVGAISDACLQIRKLSELDAADINSAFLGDYDLHTLQSEYKKSKISQFELKFITFLNYALENKEKDPRKILSRLVTSRKVSVYACGFVRSSNGAEILAQEVGGEILKIVPRISGDPREILDTGAIPGESEVDDEVLISKREKINRLVTKRSINHIKMANQSLKHVTNGFDNDEIADFYKKLENFKCEDIELYLVLILSFQFSMPIEGVLAKTNIIKGDERIRRGCLNFDCESGLFTIYPILPKVETLNIYRRSNLSVNTHDYVSIPDIFSLKILLSKYKSLYEIDQDFIFKKRSKLITKKLKGLELPRSYFGKIERFIFNKIHKDITGDICDAVLLTQRLESNAVTPLHYYNRKIHDLHIIYRNLFTDIENILRDSGIDFHMNWTNDIACEGSVGSLIVPEDQVLMSIVADLKEMLKRKSEVSLIEYHNCYTLYLILFISYSTGYRAIKCPFPNSGDLIYKNYLFISDKDNNDKYNTRPVLAPYGLLDQIEDYDFHRESIYSYLLFYDFNKLESLPRMFFLDDDSKVIDITPSSIKTYMKDYMDLPVNSNRHYLRSNLRSLSLNSEYVDYFMSHWKSGQEYFGKYSSIAINDYADKVLKDVRLILSRIGFEFIASK